MIKALKLDIIAEGIEEEQQKNFLNEAGCSKGQGFHFYKPLSAEQITELIK